MTVLLVEDDTDTRDIYSTILRYNGYEVLETENGREALELASEKQPDLILLDISLPEVDGWTVASRLRDRPETEEVPVVAVTAHALPDDQERAHELGCDSYLTKPLRPQRVLEEVRRFLPRNGEERSGDPSAEKG